MNIELPTCKECIAAQIAAGQEPPICPPEEMPLVIERLAQGHISRDNAIAQEGTLINKAKGLCRSRKELDRLARPAYRALYPNRRHTIDPSFVNSLADDSPAGIRVSIHRAEPEPRLIDYRRAYEARRRPGAPR